MNDEERELFERAESKAKELGTALSALGELGIDCPVNVREIDVTSLEDKSRRYKVLVSLGPCTRTEHL